MSRVQARQRDATGMRTGAASSTAVLTVLYVEDNASNARLLERVLGRRAAIDFTVATTGEQGLHLAAQLRPDIVLLDLHLPDLTGEDVLTGLLQLPGWADRPVVVLSADAQPATAARLRAAGAADYLTKPLDLSRLHACMDAALVGRQRRGQAC